MYVLMNVFKKHVSRVSFNFKCLVLKFVRGWEDIPHFELILLSAGL